MESSLNSLYIATNLITITLKHVNIEALY